LKYNSHDLKNQSIKSISGVPVVVWCWI